MRDNGVRISIRVDRCIRSLHNTERPKQEGKIDMERRVRDMLSWAYSIYDVSGSVWESTLDDGYNLPSAKAKRIGGNVPGPAVVVNPSLRVKFLGFGEGYRVSRYSPR